MPDPATTTKRRNTVTALIIAKNEEEILPRCLERLAWADEILVVDSFSADRTAEIAHEAGAKVLRHRFRDFSDQMNWGLERVSGEWTLQIDADEMVTPGLRDSILAVLAGEPEFDIYSVRRDGVVFGRALKSTAWSRERLPRLFRSGAIRYSGVVHSLPHVDGRPVGRLDGILIHYTYRSVEKYFEKFQLYSTLWAEKAREQGRRTSLPLATASAAWRVFHDYFIRGGIRDGRIGFVLAALAGMHTFIRHVKLWGMRNREEFARVDVGAEEKQHGT